MIEKIHKTVLKNEILKIMNPEKGKTYIDATFGCGGHAKAILDSCECNVIAFDLDDSVIDIAMKFSIEYKGRFQFFNSNFANINEIVQDKVDGIYADCGMSNVQLKSDRGFSFMRDGDLDMRMGNAIKINACNILNEYSYDKLRSIFINNADDKLFSKKLCNLICTFRENNKFTSSIDLINILNKINSKPSYKAKIFQAIRMEVNQEIVNLENFMMQAVNLAKKDAPIAIIGFHSIEDKIVRNFFFHSANTSLNRYDDSSDNLNATLYFKKPYVLYPTKEEIEDNKMARSAKIHIAYKL